MIFIQAFEDKKFRKIDPKQLKIGSRPLGEGGFGAVYKSVLLTVNSYHIMGNLHKRKHSQFKNRKLISKKYSQMTGVLTCFHAKTKRSTRKYSQMARKM